MNFRVMAVVSFFITAVFSGLSYGQSGSMNYAPTSAMQAAPVPIDGHWWLLLLALAVGGLGYRALRQHQAGRVVGMLLSFGLSLSLVAVGLYTQDAGAPPTPVVNLDNAAGGSVPVPDYFQEYLNNSGVEVEISQLTDPCGNNAPNLAEDACAESRVLALNESCATQFQCPQPEVCDGIDNDLDNAIDEGLIPPNLDCGLEDPVCTGFGGWQCPLTCVPDCSGKSCGTDGCSGSCGTCGGGTICSAGSCVAAPVCGDASCDFPENTSNCPADCGSPPI
ncbi:MAG: midcut-by-XrtH protein [Halioglobus sp.]